MASRARMTTLALAMSALAALPLSGCGQAHGANGAMAFPPPVVGVVTVEPQSVVLTSELPGRTSPYLVSEVRPQVGGVIKARLFTEGSNVRAGQPLYQIDPAPYQAAYDSAAAALAKAEANLATVKLKAERYADLVKINAVSKQDFDDQSALASQGEADVASAKAALETAQINLDYTTVTSPISGRIGAVRGHARRAGDGEPDEHPCDGPDARPDLCRRHAVERRVAASEAGDRRRRHRRRPARTAPRSSWCSRTAPPIPGPAS